MKRTPLYEIQREMGARMVPFAGWELPVQYESALKEHQAVRHGVGVFDVSHMGQIEVVGRDALNLVQKVTCNDLSRLADGQAQYSAFLTPQGTFVDDIVVYRIHPEHIFICVNAANKDKDFQWILQHQEGEAQVLDQSDCYVQLAVQGPRAQAVLQELADIDLSAIPVYRFAFGQVAGARALLSRTGYTGEDGFEIYIHPSQAEPVWKALFRAGQPYSIVPAGLAARNTLRLEMKYALYGNDIDETRTPWEAGLGWIVKMDKGDFVGKEALARQKEEGVPVLLRGFELLEPGIVRDGYPVFLDGAPVGKVTSGGFSPSLQKSIGLVYLPRDRAEIGQELEVEIRGKRRRARVVQTPFYCKS